MLCRTCHAQMQPRPAVYPTERCNWCGTEVQGSEEDQQWFVPRAWQRLIDSGGRCLRDDSAQCGLWLTARTFLVETQR